MREEKVFCDFCSDEVDKYELEVMAVLDLNFDVCPKCTRKIADTLMTKSAANLQGLKVWD